MNSSIVSDNRKKRRCRPRVGASLIGVRVPPAELVQIDEWINGQPKPQPSRPEAIRRLVELGLASARQAPGKNPTEDNKVESSKIAGRQIDRMEDPRATSEEQASRKRRLLKGPKEFREMRGDLRKKKR